MNHGRWVAHCPFCNSAEIAQPPVFFCQDCRNQMMDNKPLPFEMPRYWRAIEEVLAVRPKINRNWLPGETLKDLQRENHEHGVN
jgi:hypothetical protein